MKTKRTSLPVEWAEVDIEEVPIVSATALEALALERLFRFVQRNSGRASRSVANGPGRMAPVFSKT